MNENCDPIKYTDPDITEYVKNSLGPRCADESLVTPTVFLYVSILVVGILGNVCTCLVIFLNKSMRTPTNYYLFSLAISDLLMLILGLPVELYGVFYPTYPYQFGELTCKLRAFLIEFTSYASIVTITGFSVERWLAICFPIRARLVSTFDRAVAIIITIWIGAFMAAFPVFFIVVINRLDLPPDVAIKPEWIGTVTLNNQTVIDTEFCALDSKDINAQRTFILGAFIIFFLLPALIITAVYSHILLKIHQTDRMLGPEQRNTTKQRKALIRMLATVVCIFFVCWIPFHVQRLIAIFYPGLDVNELQGLKKAFFDSLFYLSGCFYYSNSALNPIIYNIMSTKYRRAFIKTIFCWDCSEGFYSKLNLSTHSKNRNSLSKMRTRSLSQAQNSPNKKPSSESVLLAQRSVRSANGHPM